ncbi:arginine--tRNA ligase [Jejuia spongiicola]|uniref:Arginine--tRNA ligase n=1 Tax=Jejuia spongiicola TaxID=2942207 RepID=A0ABT0QF56_9FLAO|nr:arginine--tRNA ligase [Jejuia spongiicola]MCL6295631.1 arginine--tRNA ligase [Jejuia spongiicola]
MSLQEILSVHVKQAIQTSYNLEIDTVEFQATRKEFAGDITVVIFPMLRFIKGNPVQIGENIGNHLVKHVENVKAFNVVKGFLNIEISDVYFTHFFNETLEDDTYGFSNVNNDGKAVMVEYSSPNTNKPLHLGHVRNNLLGYSVAEILKASGKKVYKTQIINDRGIHICKSMLAWERFGNGETPESTGLKGDKLVGNYYVKFDQEYKREVADLIAEGKTEDEAKKQAPILLEAQNMLLKWEAGDEETVALWEKMNSWVYKGFDITYKNLGVDFDTLYYESKTYLLGKEFVDQGLKTGVFVKEKDGSVWCDLTDEGLDKKIVQRADGTAVYMTQDIGTAIQRIKDFPDVGGMVYTVGNEQDYHFKVLFLILKKLGFDWAKNLYHLSYGMVDLPSGKMKSREGTVVDADDLIGEMAKTAGEISEELGKLDGYSETEKQELYKTIGLGALKYFILKVDPKKRILFDPKESIDFQGNTGPFIQYTYARIQSIIRKANFDYSKPVKNLVRSLHSKEKELIKQLQLFPEVIQNAAVQHSPALIANYTYDLVKEFNSFYQNVSILGADNDLDKVFRVQLSNKVALTIKNAFHVLGIQVPERM